MVEIKNLTPHVVRLQLSNGELQEFPPSGIVVRLEEKEEEVLGLPFPAVRKEFGKVQNLPEEKEGIFYIVSLPVFSAIQGRKDVVAPDTGATAVRKDGQVWAVRRFIVK